MESTPGEHAHYVCPEDVFEHDYDRLVQALTIVAGDKETAADAVQEAFVCLVRRLGPSFHLRGSSRLGAASGSNQIRDHQRSVWRQAKLLLRIEQQAPRRGAPRP